jgi:hypothetical protein
MPSPDFLRPILASFDYELDVELGPPAICRAKHPEGEKWEATGATIDDAMDKLVHMMCPSTMSWDLFLEALHVSARPSQLSVPSADRAPAPPIQTSPMAAEKPSQPPEARDRSVDPTMQIPTLAHVRSAPISVEVIEAPPSDGSALRDLELALPQIARSTPERQRLELLRRACASRASAIMSADLARDAGALVARTADIARTLWPGNLPALRSDARASDVGTLGVRGAAPPATWAEAAELAATALAALASTPNRDALGWADAASLEPPPPDSATLLEMVLVEIDALLGPPGGPIPRRVDARAPRLATVARRVRWLRGTADPMPWGSAMGRLRRALPDLGAEAEGANKLLDPAYVPDGPWAELETDEIKASPTRNGAGTNGAPSSRRGPEPPRPGAPAGELATWLLRALDQYDTPEVIALARPVGAELKSIGEAGIPTGDRRIRRKWRELLRRLG